MSNLKPIPEIGKTYHFFDDGKIKPSRYYQIIIDEVYTLETAPQFVQDWITEEIKMDHEYNLSLYSDTTDYVVRGHYKNNSDEEAWFIRTTDGGWFSLGWLSAGRLDVDGTIFENACKEYKEYGADFAAACKEEE